MFFNMKVLNQLHIKIESGNNNLESLLNHPFLYAFVLRPTQDEGFAFSMPTGVIRSVRRTSSASNFSIRSRHSPTLRTEGRKSRSSLSSAVFLRPTIHIIQYHTMQLFSKVSGSTSSNSSASPRKQNWRTRLPSNTTSRLSTPSGTRSSKSRV